MGPLVVVPLLSVMHGQCDARPTVTFPACTGIKFILLDDSWLSRLLHACLNSLDLISCPDPWFEPRPVPLIRLASTYLAEIVHSTAMLSRPPQMAIIHAQDWPTSHILHLYHNITTVAFIDCWNLAGSQTKLSKPHKPPTLLGISSGHRDHFCSCLDGTSLPAARTCKAITH